MLKLDKVSKFYSQNGVVTAGFSQVSLDFEIGEFVAITGESGSGKSTVLNVISGLDSYEEGEMYIYGQPTSGYGANDLEEYRKRHIGNIFQTFNLINHYTVYQNVEMVLLLSGYDDSEIKERVDSIIDRVGLSAYRNTKTSKLSGGQKQRVAIARALAKETPIIVADEPTGNLDVASAQDIIKLLASISKEKLIIIVTHNYEQVEPYITRKISMHDGRIAEDKRMQRTQIAPEEKAEAPSVNEARHGALSKKNTVRLGARNAFSLPAKFILLLFVFIFLTTGTFASYSAYIGMREGLSTNVWGMTFDNVSPERVVLTKPDGTEFTEKEIEEIEALDNVSYVEKHDLLLDRPFELTDNSALSSYLGYNENYGGEFEYEDVDYWISSFVKGLNALPEGDLVVGRLPENENEAVMVLRESSWTAENKMDELMSGTSYLEPMFGGGFPADGLNMAVDIVGITFFKKEPSSGGLWTESDLIMTEEGINRVEKLAVNGGTIIEAKAGDRILKVGYSYYDDVWIVADESVAKGTVEVPRFVSNLVNEVEKNVSVGLSGGSSAGKITLRVRKNTFDRTKDLTIVKVNDDDERIRVNPEDLWTLYEAPPVKQVSAMLESSLYQAETRAVLETMGYEALYLNETADKEHPLEKALIRAMRIVVIVFLLAVLFFVVYFITKLIMKSQNVYYSTVRMLGGSKGACSGTLLAELLVVFHISFVICLAIMIKITMAGSGILPAYAVRLIRYISPADYIILYLVVLFMTILLAARYSAQMFKQTAMNAYREEV